MHDLCSNLLASDQEPEPYLYALREHPDPPADGTTVSSVSRTSPVKESGPDD